MPNNTERFANRYRIEKQSVGGQAIVSQAYDTLVGRYVAIKTPGDIVMRTPKLLERFVEEARLLAQLRNDHVVEILHFYEQGEVDDRCHLVMDWLDHTLEDLCNRTDATWQTKLAVFEKVLDGMHYLHSRNIVHNDLKPSNILTSANLDIVKIADLGIASGGTDDHTVHATFKYSAPETYLGAKPDDRRLDIYSLGITFFEVFCGRERFEKCFPEIYTGASESPADNRWLNWHIAKDRQLPVLSDVDPQVPSVLSEVIRQMAAKDPSQRFQTIDEVRLALSKLTAPEAETAKPRDVSEFEADSPPTSKLTTTRLLLYSVIGFAIVAAAILAIPTAKKGPSVNPSPAPSAPSPTEVARAKAAAMALADKARELHLDPSDPTYKAGLASLNTGNELLPKRATDAENAFATATKKLTAAIDAAPRIVRLGSEPNEIALAVRLCKESHQQCNSSNYEDEAPRDVTLPPFAIDEAAVTNADFEKFTALTHYVTTAEKAGGAREFSKGTAHFRKGLSWRSLGGGSPALAAYPVRAVSHADAEAFCRSANKRLPTETEWEYAARGPQRMLFAWGDRLEDDPKQADAPLRAAMDHAPVAPLGARGMGGGVWEWVDGGTADQNVLRGPSWLESLTVNKRLAARRLERPTVVDVDDGFRCAVSTTSWTKGEPGPEHIP